MVRLVFSTNNLIYCPSLLNSVAYSVFVLSSFESSVDVKADVDNCGNLLVLDESRENTEDRLSEDLTLLGAEVDSKVLADDEADEAAFVEVLVSEFDTADVADEAEEEATFFDSAFPED